MKQEKIGKFIKEKRLKKIIIPLKYTLNKKNMKMC